MTTPDAMGLTPDAAKGYETFFVPAIFHQWPKVMVDVADVQLGDDALDVGCGTGILTRELIGLVGSSGSVTGFDLSESMLGVAKQLCPGATFLQGDATELPFEDNSFDVVTSSFMLMFVSDPVRCIQEMRRVLRPGGRLVTSVWEGLDNNIVYDALVDATRDVAGDETAESVAWPFTLGATGKLASLFESAGIAGASISSHDGTADFPGVEELVTTEIQAWLLADSVADDQINAIVNRLRSKYPPFAESNGPVTFPFNALIAKVTVS